MGLLSKTTIESVTDKIAAEIQVQLNALDTMQASWSGESLFNLIDALGDPDAEIALGSAANRVDQAMMPENWHRHGYQRDTSVVIDQNPMVKAMIADTARKAFYQDLKSYIESENGGEYANVAAYLAAVGASLHPYFAEVAYAVSANALQNSSGLTPGVFTPVHGTIPPNACYVGTAGSWTDDTTDAADVGASDVAIFASDNDCVVLGFNRPVSAIAVQLGTKASADCDVEFTYSAGGTTYNTLTVTDGTTGMGASEIITFTPPSDWAMTNVDTGGNYYAATDLVPRYYIQMKRTKDTVVTPPVVTWFRGVPTEVYNSSGRLSGLVKQPPLALVRITNAAGGTVKVIDTITPNTTHFDLPGDHLKFEVLAIGTGGNSNTITISYTDQDGNAATKAQTAWNMSSVAAGDLWPASTSYLKLAASDTGILTFLTTAWAATANTNSVILAVVSDIPAARTPAL